MQFKVSMYTVIRCGSGGERCTRITLIYKLCVILYLHTFNMCSYNYLSKVRTFV